MAAPLAGLWSLDFPNHACEALFAVAVDIESYPRFLPWCRAVRITRRGPDGLPRRVENLFGAGPVVARFESHAEPEPPHRLVIRAEAAPFRRFSLDWRFDPLPDGGCRASAAYHIELRSAVLQSLARLSLPEVERRVVQAFRDRVRLVHGG